MRGFGRCGDQLTKPRKALGNAGVTALMASLCVTALTGYRTPSGAIDLAFPLEDGTYVVDNGGDSLLINNHQTHPPQRYALDILRLDSTGNRAAFPARNLADYSIYRATVLSPCAGNVIRAVDGLPDLAPPARDTQNPAGNHVVLECHHVRVLLAHLKEESLLVARGEYVETGQHLGQVGNSGNTSEPHLHIHAESGLGEILTGEGIPITLDGRFLVRNSLIPR